MTPEKVLVVPRIALFGDENERYFQGFKPAEDLDFAPYIDRFSTFLLRRETSLEQPLDAEHDPSFKQIIPYILFRYSDKFFVYQRTRGQGKEQGEHRLFDKHSLGLGGHINPCDQNDRSHFLEEALTREFNEELSYTGEHSGTILGYLNDDSDDVGQVHFGVVYLVDGTHPNVSIREKDKMVARGFMTVDNLVRYQEQVESSNPFENWSKLVINYLKHSLN